MQTQTSNSYRDQPDLPDLPGWRLRYSLPGHSRAVTAVRLSPNGLLLASASADGSAAIWRTDSGQLVHRLMGHSGGLSDVAWSRDGRLVATASDDGNLRLWEAASGDCLKVLKGHTHHVMSCCFSPGGNLLVRPWKRWRAFATHTRLCIDQSRFLCAAPFLVAGLHQHHTPVQLAPDCRLAVALMRLCACGTCTWDAASK